MSLQADCLTPRHDHKEKELTNERKESWGEAILTGHGTESIHSYLDTLAEKDQQKRKEQKKRRKERKAQKEGRKRRKRGNSQSKDETQGSPVQSTTTVSAATTNNASPAQHADAAVASQQKQKAKQTRQFQQQTQAQEVPSGNSLAGHLSRAATRKQASLEKALAPHYHRHQHHSGLSKCPFTDWLYPEEVLWGGFPSPLQLDAGFTDTKECTQSGAFFSQQPLEFDFTTADCSRWLSSLQPFPSGIQSLPITAGSGHESQLPKRYGHAPEAVPREFDDSCLSMFLNADMQPDEVTLLTDLLKPNGNSYPP